jgi:hypothetical protein
MSRVFPILVLGLLGAMLAVASVGAAIGQTGILAGLVQPFVVNIEQQVPVEVTLALPMEDGAVITATAPLTVGISLQVKIDGAQVVAVTSAEAEPAAIEATGAEGETAGTDDAGLSWSLLSEDSDPQIALEDWTGYSAPDGDFEVAGRLRNLDTARRFSLATVELRFYDADGDLVRVENVSASGHWVDPGGFIAFDTSTALRVDDAARYTIRVLVNDWRLVP